VPRELVAVAPREPVLRTYDPPPLGPGLVRLVAELGSPKHGTELMAFRGPISPVSQANPTGQVAERYDPAAGYFKPLPPGTSPFPRLLGNMVVGRVEAVGEGVAGLAPGDRVYGHLPLRDVHVVPAERLTPLPADLSPEAAVCLDPAESALAVRDAHVRLGDRVAVFGLGAIGLFALQYARLSGAALVVGVDPIERRRRLALRLGADVTLDPGAEDVGAAIRDLTRGLGADVTLEVSGNARALHQAIRATRFEGTVGVLAAHAGGAPELFLGREFHWNAIQLVSCRTASQPLRDFGWDQRRIVELAESLLRRGRLQCEGIVQPVVPFEESAEAYRQIEAHPETCVKLGVRF
jgi:threonine dehydrogenase-like Zn-dependent dehydrogenase